MPFNRTCPRCGSPCSRQRVYCSRTCANASKARPLPCTCEACGRAFTVKPSIVGKGGGKNCSQACYDISRGARIRRACVRCGEAFETKPSRLKQGAAYCSHACYAASRAGKPSSRPSTRVPRQCVGCGATFTVYPSQLKYGVALWCSPSCRYSTPGWADVLHPNGSKMATCGECGKSFRAVASAPAVYCSRACLGIANGKRQEGTGDPSKRTMKPCLECGTLFEALVCVGDRAKFCSRQCLGGWTIRNRDRIALPTSIEVAMKAALDDCGISTVSEMKSGRFSIDLAIPEARLAIETDGRYWHSLPGMIERDARKDAALAAQGWAVLRFGEDQINSDIASCVAAVMEALESRQ